MNPINIRPSFWLAALLTVTALAPRNANATIVEFQTVMGTFEVNLYDNATPETVLNFLSYVNGLQYTNSIFHRSVPGFIVQGGGFVYSGTFPPAGITASAPVVNEPEFSNVRGTIAMAKLGGDPNSATNQWFFNLANNSANLDVQNGGFTVFGEVVGNGMVVIDDIAALPIFDFSASHPALTDLPLQNYNVSTPPDANHLIIISAIVVSDPTVDSAAGLNPPPNTLINPPPAPPPAPSGGGGGSFGVFTLFGLLLIRRFTINSRCAGRAM